MSETIGHGVIDKYFEFAEDWSHLEEARTSQAITELHAAMTLYRMCNAYVRFNKHAYAKWSGLKAKDLEIPDLEYTQDQREYNRELKERLKDGLKAPIAERD